LGDPAPGSFHDLADLLLIDAYRSAVVMARRDEEKAKTQIEKKANTLRSRMDRLGISYWKKQ